MGSGWSMSAATGAPSWFPGSAVAPGYLRPYRPFNFLVGAGTRQAVPFAAQIRYPVQRWLRASSSAVISSPCIWTTDMFVGSQVRIVCPPESGNRRTVRRSNHAATGSIIISSNFSGWCCTCARLVGLAIQKISWHLQYLGFWCGTVKFIANVVLPTSLFVLFITTIIFTFFNIKNNEIGIEFTWKKLNFESFRHKKTRTKAGFTSGKRGGITWTGQLYQRH